MGMGVPCMRSGLSRMGTEARGWWVPATILGGLVMLGSGGCRMYWPAVIDGTGTVSGLLERRSGCVGADRTVGELALSRLNESEARQTPDTIRDTVYSICLLHREKGAFYFVAESGRDLSGTNRTSQRGSPGRFCLYACRACHWRTESYVTKNTTN